MCTSVMGHTSNGYYYTVMEMRTIFLPRQGIDEPKDVSYRKFKAAISTAELEKQNAINHVELNEACAYGYDEDGTKRFQEMCLIISSDSD